MAAGIELYRLREAQGYILMLTVFCLLLYGKFPHELGVPQWAILLSLGVTSTLALLLIASS